MPYELYWGTTDISDKVVGASEVPLLDCNYENMVAVPTASFTVISDDIEYAVNDQLLLYKDGKRIWHAIIDTIDVNYEANTKTLNAIDAIALLKNHYVRNLADADYLAGFTMSEDNNGSINMRYSTLSSTTPHRSQFVTLTHFLKMCAVKIGVVDSAAYCDATDFYGAKPSGYVYYTGSASANVNYDELTYHPKQIKWAKLTNSTDPIYDGATLLDVFLYTLQVLGGVYRYDGDLVVFERRNVGSSTPANDAKYAVSVSGYTNEFDQIKAAVTYVKTVTLSGFNPYISGGLTPSGDLLDESNIYPVITSPDRKIVDRSISIMRHAIVHRRKFLTTVYQMEELHFNASALPTYSEYFFSYQFAKIMYSRFPGAGKIESFTTSDALDTRAARLPLRKLLNIENRTLRVEY